MAFLVRNRSNWPEMMLKMMIIREGMVTTCLIKVGLAAGNEALIRLSMGATAALVNTVSKDMDKIAGFFKSINELYLCN